MKRALPNHVFDDDAPRADRLTVEARKRVSALFSSFSAVMKEAGIDGACEALKGKIFEGTSDRRKEIVFDPNEIRRVYQTIVEAAQLAELEAERLIRDHPFYSPERQFRFSAARMEMLYRRERMPKFSKDADGEKERSKFLNTRARSWHRRFKRLHYVQ